jgi:hypothetical protein
MKSLPIIIALFAVGLATQGSDAVAKECKPINVAATGFGDSKGVAKSLAWEAWEADVESRTKDDSFSNSDNVGSGSEDCSLNKSGKYSGRGIIPSSMGHPASAWVCVVSGNPCDEK